MQVAEDKAGARFVVFVAEGSPAQRQGIHVGDRLLQINGDDASSLSKEYSPTPFSPPPFLQATHSMNLTELIVILLPNMCQIW